MIHNSSTQDSIDSNETDTIDRRNFLRGAAASAAGLTGLGIASDSAAARSQKRLVVVGDGSGHHTYEIEMKRGGSISRGSNLEGHDDLRTQNGRERAEGELWGTYKDVYTYTGEIRYIEGDGALKFQFPSGCFESDSDIGVHGRGSGRHLYEIETDGGDIDLNPKTTEYVDSDDRGAFSEWMSTTDVVSGALRGNGDDSYSLETGYWGGQTAINEMRIKQGQVRFGASAAVLPTTLDCSYELTIDHSNDRIAGTYSGGLKIDAEFNEDRSEVRILNFPDIEVSYQTPVGEITTTVSRIKEQGRTTGSFDDGTGTLTMPLDLDFEHSKSYINGSTAAFDLTTGSRNESGFSMSGHPLKRQSLDLKMVGVGQFQGGFLDGTDVSLKIEGSLSDSPF